LGGLSFFEYAVGKGALSFVLFEDDNFCISNFKGIQMRATTTNTHRTCVAGGSVTSTATPRLYCKKCSRWALDCNKLMMTKTREAKKCGKDATATFKGLIDIW